MRFALLFAAAFALAIAARAAAQVQGWSVDGVVVSANHELLGNPLVGGGVAFRVPVRQGPFAFRFGGEWLGGQADRIGVPCGGLIRPGTCAPEPVRDRSRLTTIRSGGTLRVFGGQRVAINIAADWMMTLVSADTRGLASGDAVSGGNLLWGPWIGISADWVPAWRVPIGVEVEGGRGSLIGVMNGQVEDGYTPFDTGFGVRHLRLGLVWRPRL